MIMAKKHLVFASIVMLFAVNGCSVFTNTEEDTAGNKAEVSMDVLAQKLLTEGMEEYRYGKYFNAIKSFKEIINRYPFSHQAVEAELKAADCSYHMEQYSEAEILYNSFEDHHPSSKSLPYVLYQKGMCNYRQIDRIDRDPRGAEKAIRYFKQLLKAFPHSPYSADAKEKVTLATDFLAGHEFSIAEFYVRTEKPAQAKARLRYLLANYPQSTAAKKGRTLLQQLEKKREEKKSFFSTLPGFSFFQGEEQAAPPPE